VFLYQWGPLGYVPPVDLSGWLAREAEQDQADGMAPTVTDPVALRLLALGLTQARAGKQAPVVPPVPRN
jgi:hypothetical protein